MKKEPLLEKLFLASAVLDAVFLSLVILFLLTIFTICFFLSGILLGTETIVLFIEVIKNIMHLHLFIAIGFLGMSLLFSIVTILLFLIFSKIIKGYPKVIRNLQKFIFLSKITKLREKSKKSHILKWLIIIFVAAIILILISIITNSFNPVIKFVYQKFNFDNIGRIFEGWFL